MHRPSKGRAAALPCTCLLRRRGAAAPGVGLGSAGQRLALCVQEWELAATDDSALRCLLDVIAVREEEQRERSVRGQWQECQCWV